MSKLLQNARDASFLTQEDQLQLSHLIYGGKTNYELVVNTIGKRMHDNNLPKTYLTNEMSKFEITDYTVRRNVEGRIPVMKGLRLAGIPSEGTLDGSVHLIGLVGLWMVSKLLELTGTEEQKARYLHAVDTHLIIAAYVQTELGHGSDVQSLKTVCTFDEAKKCFVLHTPSIDAIKWWPGDLSTTATVALVMARLVIKGKDLGPQAFMVQIRDPETHEVMPGVEIGDIGSKLGYNTKDNGFARFNRVQLPLDSLLGKYISVDKQGNVTQRGDPKILYAGMMKVRSSLIAMAGAWLLRSALIAVRYSHVRLQFKDENNKEQPVFQYQMQKNKLVTEVAKAYGSFLSTRFVKEQVEINEHRITTQGDFSGMKSIHISLSGHKAILTEWASYGMANLVRACGGHGYSEFSGIPMMYKEQFPDMILEGENSVLILQIASEILKALRQIQSRKTEKTIKQLRYLGNDYSGFNLPETKEAFEDLDQLNKLFEKAVQYLGRNVALAMFGEIQKGQDPKDVYNQVLNLRLYAVGRLHSVGSICKNAASYLESRKDLSPAARGVVKDLLRYLYIVSIEQEIVRIMEADCLNKNHLVAMEEAKEEILERVSVHLLILTEALDVSDFRLGSAIAGSDGKPYETLYAWAKEYGVLNRYEGGIQPGIIEMYHPWKKLRGLFTGAGGTYAKL